MPKPKLLKKGTTLALQHGALRVAVVADTHSEPHPRTEELIAELEPHHIIHAGDIGDLSVVERLSRIAPTSPVRGNIDVHAADLPDVVTIDVRTDSDASNPDAGETLFKILLLHIAVNGPKLRADAARLARAEGAKLVICGHSHVPFIGRDRDLSIFNPGSVGPRRFHLPIVFGVMDVTPRRVEMKHIDCETGRRWLP
jgi:putative phosphoesterase